MNLDGANSAAVGRTMEPTGGVSNYFFSLASAGLVAPETSTCRPVPRCLARLTPRRHPPWVAWHMSISAQPQEAVRRHTRRNGRRRSVDLASHPCGGLPGGRRGSVQFAQSSCAYCLIYTCESPGAGNGDPGKHSGGRMIRTSYMTKAATIAVALTCSAAGMKAQTQPGNSNGCASLPDYATLKAALVAATSTETSGLNNQMWATIVDRDGIVCAVAFSGVNRGAQWPGSRVISAQKANTANAFSLDASSNSNGSGQAGGLALSTANLYSAVQPGGSLFGLQESNPVDTQVAYQGPSSNYGTPSDPMVGLQIGGVNVFGGGLALYQTPGASEILVGGVGVSGDTSCADHNIAWRVRHNLGLDHLANTAGVSGDPTRPDNILFDISPNPGGGTGISAGGFGHPMCLNNTTNYKTLPVVSQ
jgi:uncharacterized protein GlcG (DUF336 family)